MIKKLKIGLLITILSLTVGVGSVAYATDAITYTDDTIVTVGAYNYTIVGGSTATSVAVGAADLTVVMPSGSTLTLTSADRKLLGTDQASGYSSTCAASISTTVLYQTTGAPVTFVIAPTGDCSPVTSGGGGGSSTSTTDTTAPTNTSVSINAGISTASSISATLTLAATDNVGVTHMLISNDASFVSATWETYATSKVWTLISGDGVKTVYAKFKDAAGNVSTAILDTITVSGSGTVYVPPSIPTTPTTYNFSTTTLRIGSTGEAVKELQRFLNATMNLGLVVDGIFGPNTSSVMKKWQTAHGLVADGLIGPKTKAAMLASIGTTPVVLTTTYNFGTTTLKNGSKGEAVKELQRFLNATMSLGLVVDGMFGPHTTTVMKQWQTDHNLVADGLVGPATKAKMNASVE